MKKTMCLISLLGLCACATGGTKTENGLIRLDAEPKNCQFLYNLDSSVTTYKLSDAYNYVEQSILENKSLGDSYYVVSENTVDNVGAIFGPEHIYKFKIKVYNCNN